MAQVHMNMNMASPSIRKLVIIIVASALLSSGEIAGASYRFDLVSEAIRSPLFKNKTPLEKLRLAADLLRTQRLSHSDMSFLVLDWADQYLREPEDPLKRLKRWASLTEDEQLSKLRIPRDYLNRVLVAEYLVRHTDYLKAGPKDKLVILRNLSEENLVDWSVSLAYARIYAGAVIMEASAQENPSPMRALEALKKIKEEELVGWHYRAPTEAIICSQALALDEEFIAGDHLFRLRTLRNLQDQGLIIALTRKELERLPAWRLLVKDEEFLESGLDERRKRLSEIKNTGLILSSTYSDLERIFCKDHPRKGLESGPNPLPPNIQNR
jgi:hypothetical protein